VHLNDHHRDTLKKIFSHSSSDNIAWRHVFSLLNAVGAATEEHNGKVRVTLAPETEVLRPPHGQGRRRTDARRSEADAPTGGVRAGGRPGDRR
jgi:hypothetical protein